jgi:uncharacterized protein (DUF305 family)
MKLFKVMKALCAVVLALGITSGVAQAAPFDQQFIDSMVPHHQSALMMAQMAVSKAPHAQVKMLARGIIRDQQREIAQMKAWRKAWFGSAQVPMDMMNGMKISGMGGMNHGSMSGMKMSMSNGVMTMPGEMMGLPMKMKMDMGRLMRLKGGAFEKMFLAMMIPHHASAISMAQEAIDASGRPQIRIMAHNIIDSQAKEIGVMRALHNRFYGQL